MGKLFDVQVKFEYQGINGGNSGGSETRQNALTQAQMEYYRRRITELNLQLGLEALRDSGEAAIDPPVYDMAPLEPRRQ